MHARITYPIGAAATTLVCRLNRNALKINPPGQFLRDFPRRAGPLCENTHPAPQSFLSPFISARTSPAHFSLNQLKFQPNRPKQPKPVPNSLESARIETNQLDPDAPKTVPNHPEQTYTSLSLSKTNS